MQHQQQVMQPQAPPQQSQQSQQQAQAQQAQQHPAIEFDHAISYVTTIKKRFANSPEIYQSFLEILHTYQKQQKGIREVLEQVAELFADHPDLLKQFTYFLPDAVQEQAKERLYKAAHESEMRLAHQHNQHQHNQNQPKSQQKRKFIDLSTPTQAQTSTPFSTSSAVATPSSEKKHAGKAAAATPTNASVNSHKFVFSASVERQFFDAVKETLVGSSRDGNVAWQGFLRCLDMYSQETLSREEMLHCVEDLLGKRHAHLLETFKQMLHYVGVLTVPGKTTNIPVDDVWYSVPLAEIDFSRCRQCTPSYRALPRDYPLPPCSARTTTNASVLNNVWVSLPVGSEESYTFRHMRRNAHEEALFKVEDERFEIDMVIDSNWCTINRLGELLNEIELLKDLDGVTYKVPDDYFNTIHRHCIQRIYGSDYGSEILSLIYSNPLKATGIVYNRLKQKDEEWRTARLLLSAQWRVTQESNWKRSLDHRSLTYKQHDKRLTSTRSLLAEIRDFAANGGKESVESKNARREKAKEEYGSFYDVTMPQHQPKYPPPPPIKPSAGLSVHLSLCFAREFAVDAYKVIAFGVERGNSSPGDKERIHVVFKDFLGDVLGLAPSVMCSTRIPCNISDYSVGSYVATVYGVGEIVSISGDIMEVKLPFGVAAIHKSNLSILYSARKPVNSPKAVVGTQSLYLFMRLFQLLCSRLQVARELSKSVKVYDAYLNTLYALLDSNGPAAGGNNEVHKYEDRVRHLLSHKAYALLTMDKLIHYLIKHLTTLSSSFVSNSLFPCHTSQSQSAYVQNMNSLAPLYHEESLRNNLSRYKAAAATVNANNNQENLFLIELNAAGGCLFVEYLGSGNDYVAAVSDTESNAGSNADGSEQKKQRKA